MKLIAFFSDIDYSPPQPGTLQTDYFTMSIGTIGWQIKCNGSFALLRVGRLEKLALLEISEFKSLNKISPVRKWKNGIAFTPC